MTDYASVPGAEFTGTERGDFLNADIDLPGSADNWISVLGGQDTVLAGAGNDTVLAGKGHDLVDGGTGDDRLEGEDGHDTMSGGQGTDTLLGGKGHDQLDGGTGDDRLEGGEGHDTLTGGQGDDLLLGGDGHDHLAGGAGADGLTGGTGHDTLSGGSGGDTFYFDSGFGRDVVMDFNAAEGDTLAIKAGINGLSISRPEDLAAFVRVEGGATVIKLGNDTITLNGISRADLVANIDRYVTIV